MTTTGGILDTTAIAAEMAFRAPDPAQFKHPCPRCGVKMLRPGTCWDCEIAVRDEKERAAKIRRALEVIPLRYRDARFGGAMMAERVADTRSADVAQDALAHHVTVVLQGVPGTGKSTVAGAISADEASQGRTIAWAPAMRLAQARAEARLGSEPEEVRAAIRAHVTVIDDLGNEPLTTQSAVLDVVFSRHDAERPLIVTTGLSRLELAKRYGGGAGRRLCESALWVELRAKGAMR